MKAWSLEKKVFNVYYSPRVFSITTAVHRLLRFVALVQQRFYCFYCMILHVAFWCKREREREGWGRDKKLEMDLGAKKEKKESGIGNCMRSTIIVKRKHVLVSSQIMCALPYIPMSLTKEARCP